MLSQRKQETCQIEMGDQSCFVRAVVAQNMAYCKKTSCISETLDAPLCVSSADGERGAGVFAVSYS
jgi:hypothetical protein